jgi:hypothetical protein
MKHMNLLTPAWLLLPAIEERVMIFFNELKQMTGYWCTTSSPNQEELSKSNIILQRIRKRKKGITIRWKSHAECFLGY